MATNKTLTKRVAQFLEPGEEVEAVFPAQSGPNPWWSALWGWAVMAASGAFGFVTIVATDRATIVLRNVRMFRFRPVAVVYRGPREPLGNPTGIWGKVYVGGERYWVNWQFRGEARLANDLLESDAPPPPQA